MRRVLGVGSHTLLQTVYRGRGARHGSSPDRTWHTRAHSPEQRGREYLGHGRVSYTRPEGELVALDKDGPERGPEGLRHIAAVRHRSGQPTVSRDLPDASSLHLLADRKSSHLHAKSP